MSPSHPLPPTPTPRGLVAAQAIFAGPIDTGVRAVTARVAGAGNEVIALRLGSLLVYVEDREALDALGCVLRRADALADRVFGPPEDAFTALTRREDHFIARHGRLPAVQSR